MVFQFCRHVLVASVLAFSVTTSAAPIRCALIGASYDVDVAGYLTGSLDDSGPVEQRAGLGAPLRYAATAGTSGIQWVSYASSGASSGYFTLVSSTGVLNHTLQWDGDNALAPVYVSRPLYNEAAYPQSHRVTARYFNKDNLGLLGQHRRIVEANGAKFGCMVIGISGEFWASSALDDTAGVNWSGSANSYESQGAVAGNGRGDARALPTAPMPKPWTPPVLRPVSPDPAGRVGAGYLQFAKNVGAMIAWGKANHQKIFVEMYPPARLLTGLPFGSGDTVTTQMYERNREAYVRLLASLGFVDQSTTPHVAKGDYYVFRVWDHMQTASDHVHPSALSECQAARTINDFIAMAYSADHATLPRDPLDCQAPAQASGLITLTDKAFQAFERFPAEPASLVFPGN